MENKKEKEEMENKKEKEEMENKDFQVGDFVEVLEIIGYGKVSDILDLPNIKYPIMATWPNGTDTIYTQDGKYLESGDYPTLFHKGSIKREGNKIIIDPVKPIRWPWVNVYKDKNGQFKVGKPKVSRKNALTGPYFEDFDGEYLFTIQLKPPEEE